MKKKPLLAGLVLLLLAGVIAFPFWNAARDIEAYVKATDPHFAPFVKTFAIYNPVNSNFNMTITDDSGAAIFLERDPGGYIRDQWRQTRYYEEAGLTGTYRTDNGYGLLYCHWHCDDPTVPRLSLVVLLTERVGTAPEDMALREELTQCLLDHYALLPGEAQENVRMARVYHLVSGKETFELRVELPNAEPLTRAHIDTAALRKN